MAQGISSPLRKAEGVLDSLSVMTESLSYGEVMCCPKGCTGTVS